MKEIKPTTREVIEATPATVLAAGEFLAGEEYGRRYRHGVNFVERGDAGRKADGGPMIPGPWAYAYGLCTSITSTPGTGSGADRARNVANGTEFDVIEGDRVRVDGVLYVIRFAGWRATGEWIALDETGK